MRTLSLLLLIIAMALLSYQIHQISSVVLEHHRILYAHQRILETHTEGVKLLSRASDQLISMMEGEYEQEH